MLLSVATNWNDFSGRAVLITGGTRGIGLATGLAFARRGAAVTLTHKWGSADEMVIRAAFDSVGAQPPHIAEADVAQEDDIRAVISGIRERHQTLDTFVSNVAFAPVVKGIEEYTKRGFASGFDYSVWPIVSHTKIIREVFGAYPRYILAMSSEGSESYHMHYDMVASIKASLETLCKYMNVRLQPHGSRVNVLRTRFTGTESLLAISTDEFEPFAEIHSPGLFTKSNEVGEAAAGLCCGLMDAVGGQIVTVNHGADLFDSYSRLYEQRKKTGLPPAFQKKA